MSNEIIKIEQSVDNGVSCNGCIYQHDRSSCICSECTDSYGVYIFIDASQMNSSDFLTLEDIKALS